MGSSHPHHPKRLILPRTIFIHTGYSKQNPLAQNRKHEFRRETTRDALKGGKEVVRARPTAIGSQDAE